MTAQRPLEPHGVLPVIRGLARGLCTFSPPLCTNLQELEARSGNNEVSVLLLLANTAATERKSKSQIVNSPPRPRSAKGPNLI